MSRKGRKRKLGAEDKAHFEWEKDRILPENLRDEMESMWEIPQIYHFLQLTKEVLNISHLSMYEVERMLLMPKASKQLAHIMTCLLSSPSTTKSKLHKVPPMPYEFWTNILSYKLRSWFKIYHTKHQNSVKVFDTLGVEPEFWNVFPNAEDIEGKDFLDFTFKQRVWLLKTVCDTAMHTRKTIQDEIAKQPWESQFETVLGIDRYGARYIYFPQFLHNDLRVYRHSLDNKVLSTVKPPVEEVKPKVEVKVELKEGLKRGPRIGSKKKRRKSRWSNGSLPPKKLYKRKLEISSMDHNIIDSNSNSTDGHFLQRSRSSSKASIISAISLAKSSGYETNISTDAIDNSIVNEECEKDQSKVEDANASIEESKDEVVQDVSSCDKKSEDSVAVNDLDKSIKTSPRSDDVCLKETSFSAMDDLSKSSKTDDEKLEEMSCMNVSKTSEKTETDVQLFSGLTKDVNISKSDDEKLSESKKCDSEFLNEDMSLDKWMDVKRREEREDENCNSSDNGNYSDSTLSNSGTRRSARIKYISEIKLEIEDAENMADVCESEELSSIELRDSLCRISSPEVEVNPNEDFNEKEWKVENFNQLMTDLSVSHFQLAADSLESLKDLIESISLNKTVPGQESKREHFRRPSCEEKLLKRLKVLCASLEKVETILKESTKKARNKLQREWNNFENGVADDDQDTRTGEDGTINGWVMGPQASYQISCTGTATTSTTTTVSSSSSSICARTLSHPSISTVGVDESSRIETPRASSADTAEEASSSEQNITETNEETVEQDQEKEKGSGEGKIFKEESCGRAESKEEEEGKDDNCEATKVKDFKKEKVDQQEAETTRPTRVLRARGVSSYTEQLFSDDESEEEKLDGWTDIEAIYTTPSSQIDSSAPNTPAKARDSCNDTEEEDSDQDWILPSSRKRKSKRPSANRRLKTFQHKIQNIRVDQEGRPHVIPTNDTKVQAFPGKSQPIKLPARPIYNKVVPNVKPVAMTVATPNATATSTVPLTTIKSEPIDPNLHSVLDIKDEGPIYDTTNQNVKTYGQPNYVVVTTGQAPVTNYYVMQQNPPITAVVQQNQFIQPTAFQMVPQQPQVQPIQQVQAVPGEGYYIQQNPQQNYIVQNSTNFITTANPRQAFIASANAPVVYQQPSQIVQPPQQMVQTTTGYVQYVTAPQQQTSASTPRIINTMTLSPPRQIYRVRGPAPNNRMVGPRPNFPHPNGAVIRSAPLAPNVLRPGQRLGHPRHIAPRRPAPKMQNPNNKQMIAKNAASKGQKTTSLIVLSDSDDEIEMIITEKKDGTKSIPKPKPAPPQPQPSQQPQQPQQKKPVLPAELMQRMSEGGVSISPIKPAQPAVSQSTQLVVVVNETGSHYALALPNGSKLILTPEQVAQIRASNGGKLVL